MNRPSRPPPIPPKPAPRGERVSLRQYLRLFRQDILSAQPARLYRAWMAEFRTPFFRSFLVNQPDLVELVLKRRPADFPKSGRISEGLRPLLGNSVFLTNGAAWERQRRIIDPAFEGGRLRDTFGAMYEAGGAAVARLGARAGQVVEFEEVTSHAAADVIFRTLFSIPIDNEVAARVFTLFREYQREQPLVNLAAFIPLPRRFPRFFSRRTRETAREIRALIAGLVDERRALIARGAAPDDLATKIMTTRDPQTGETFGAAEMVDQVAIFFLAGHETSASALAWAFYLAALYPEWQERIAREARALGDGDGGGADFAAVKRLRIARDVFRETLRLYPPVPMMVREAARSENFRDRAVPKGSQIVLSPWHLHRHERLWDDPDGFDPDRWQRGEGAGGCPRGAYIPFSAGPRVCTGAGFAMIEGPLLLSMVLRRFRLSPVAGHEPVPVAHLTVRSRDGIRLRVEERGADRDQGMES